MVNIAIILLTISLILLVIYGLDTMIAANKSQGEASGTGFLPMNEAFRGAIFGGGAVLLSIAGFVIGLKQQSKVIPILLIVNGSLIILGMVIVMGMNILTSDDSIRTVIYTMLLGAILIVLGIIKIIKDRRTMRKRTGISN